jgi:hypothetical protein
MVGLPGWVGPRYNENGIRPGAQTKRPGSAWPVSDLLGGNNSPATLVFEIQQLSAVPVAATHFSANRAEKAPAIVCFSE